MTKLVHTRGGKIFLAVLFGLMSLSLMSFGLPGMSGFGQPNAARVGDFKITAGELDQEFSNELQAQMQQTGTFVNRVQALDDGVLEETLARMILRLQMQQAAVDAGIRITDETLATIIRNTRGFQDQDGNFDRERFNFIIHQAGLTPETYAAETRKEVTRGQMSQAVISGVQAPDIMLELLASYEGRTRNVSYIRLNEATVPVTEEPTDDALQALFQDNLALFETPERRTVTVLRFGPADVADRVTVTEAEIVGEYNRQIDSFRVGAQRRFEQVLLDNTEQADILASAAANAPGDSLEALVQTALPDLGTPVIEVEWAEQDSLLPELADAVFAMNIGDLSAAIETDLGIFVVRLTGEQDAGTRPMDDVREALVNQLQRRNAADALFDFSADIEQALAAGKSLEDTAAEFGLVAVQITNITEDGTLPAGVEMPAGIDLNTVADEAFYLEIGENSPLLETINNGYMAVRLDDISPASTDSLEDARARLVEMWQTSQRRRVAADAAAAITEAVSNGRPWNDAIADAGLGSADLEVLNASDVTRRSGDATLVPALVRTIFDLPETGAADRLRIGNVWYVVRLEGTNNQDLNASETGQLTDALRESMTYDILSQYQLLLDSRYPARINYSVIDSFHNPQNYQR